MSAEIEMFDRLRKVEMQIGTHETVCAERYSSILKAGEDTKDALATLQKLLVKVGLGLISVMGAVLIKLVFFPHSG
jgi:bacterioferritin (cytochrome b1)